MTTPFASPTSRRQAALVAIGILLVASAALGIGGTRLADEWVHYGQVRWLAEGRYELVEELTTIPGYHAVVAVVQRLAGSDALGLARAVTMAFALAAVLAFASIRRELFPAEDPWLPASQLLFLPILFPFCFLLYTDIPSLALVLWTFRASLSRRHLLAGTLGIAALLMRQTNVVWIVFFALLQAIETIRAADSPVSASRTRLSALTALWPYAMPVVLFAGYWVAHGSISLSRSQVRAHPDFALHTGNLFFMLFLAGVFFLPLLPLWLRRYADAVRARPLWLVLPLFLGSLYALSFRVDHPYNFILPETILRNGVLVYVTAHRWAFVAFGLVATAAGCALSQIRWQRGSFALLFPIAALFVSASWLIEQRYYVIPLALLLAMRDVETPGAERALLLWWMPMATALLVGMLNAIFFI